VTHHVNEKMIHKHIAIKIFILIEMLVVAYILFTMEELPENIASHFNSVGIPNGFMSQKGYLIFMLMFAIGVPGITVFGISAALRWQKSNINIPNKDFWLAPERRQSTIEFLTGHISWLGSMITLFIAYIHWLIIQANSTQPTQLSNSYLFAGVGVLIIAILLWTALLSIRFLKIPKQ
jgi:uncharacterized membrane protein